MLEMKVVADIVENAMRWSTGELGGGPYNQNFHLGFQLRLSRVYFPLTLALMALPLPTEYLTTGSLDGMGSRRHQNGMCSTSKSLSTSACNAGAQHISGREMHSMSHSRVPRDHL